jgi:amino acid transporter
MIFLTPALFIGWKIVKKTKWYKPHEVDLQGEVKEIDEVNSCCKPHST